MKTNKEIAEKIEDILLDIKIKTLHEFVGIDETTRSMYSLLAELKKPEWYPYDKTCPSHYQYNNEFVNESKSNLFKVQDKNSNEFIATYNCKWHNFYKTDDLNQECALDNILYWRPLTKEES